MQRARERTASATGANVDVSIGVASRAFWPRADAAAASALVQTGWCVLAALASSMSESRRGSMAADGWIQDARRFTT